MASILQIGDKWRAQVRKPRQKSVSKTFDTKLAAEKWARGVEHKADSGHKISTANPFISSLLQEYETKRSESNRPIAKQTNEYYMLRQLIRGLQGERLSDLGTEVCERYARARKRSGAGPYTINMEFSKLNTALTYICSLKGIPYHNPISAARPTLRHFGLIGSQNKRKRRPSEQEWLKLMAYFTKYEAESQRPLPMRDILEFASMTGLRRSELCRILWSDLDQERRVILVRDRKHPREKKGNNEYVPLVGTSLDVIMRQPRNEERIFPYNPQSISDQFTAACKFLEIEDLHLHDMRHEAVSKLFEAGWDIAQVAAVSGHKDWRALKTYTQIDPASVALKKARV